MARPTLRIYCGRRRNAGRRGALAGRFRYNRTVAKKDDSSRVPSAVGSIPLVGDLVKSADQQARWMQELVEQNARLIGQFPATMKSFNDALERFNETIGRLDRAVTQIENASRQLTGPLEKAVRATTDTQKQVARLQSTLERAIGAVADLPLPGLSVLRRIVKDGGADKPS